MTSPAHRPRSGRQYTFSLRRLSVCFGFIALVFLAAGTADKHPVAAAVALGLLVLAAVVTTRRRREKVAAGSGYVTQDAAAEADFEAMTPEQFERAVADLCERDGCRFTAHHAHRPPAHAAQHRRPR